ncbi:NVEALA domain-containing protein, partial [Phocaeicola massiliensis]
NVYNSQKSDVMSELALANVEALADDESVTVECPGGTDECARVLVGNTVHLFYKK